MTDTRKVKLELKDIYKSFDKKEVIKGVSEKFHEGESIVVIGGSGAGKTVMFKMLSTLMDPTTGTRYLDGVDISKVTRKNQGEIMKKISFAFQLNALFDSSKIWENIMFVELNNGKRSKAELKKDAIKLLDMVDLKPETADLYPSDLSGGMQKRVAIARAIATNPEIVFFDEPTSGLDPLTSHNIAKLIRDIKRPDGKQVTRFSIMHDMKSAKVVATRVLFLYQGKIEWQGTPEEMETTQNPHLREFVDSAH